MQGDIVKAAKWLGGSMVLASFILAAVRHTWQEPEEVEAEFISPEDARAAAAEHEAAAVP